MKFTDTDISIVPIGDTGDAFIETESSFDFDVCDVCGALLADEELHRRWHES